MIDILKYIDEMQVMYGDKEPSSMDQEPRNMAQVPRSEMDNFNTPDLDQGADSILKPGQTLEDDFDVTFRKPNAQGGVQQLVSNTVDGSRPGYKGKPYLDQKKFIEEFTTQRIKGDKTTAEFVEYLNNNYKPSPQTDKFNIGNVDRRMRVLQKKGLISMDIVTKGSKADLALTPKKYISLLGEEGYAAVKDNPTLLKSRYEYAREMKNNPNFLDQRKIRRQNWVDSLSPEEYEEKVAKPARIKNAEKRGNFPKFTVDRNNSKSLMWKDLVSRTYGTQSDIRGKPYFTFETPLEEGKKYNTADMKNIVLKDSKGNKFKFDTLFNDVKKVAGEKEFNMFKNTYDQRAFMNRDGITKELNKLYGNKPGSFKSVFNIQHIEGFNINPFKVHMTFADQNFKENSARRTFTSDFGKANTYSQKKTAINNYYKSLGPDIVAQIGKKPKGVAKPLMELLNLTPIKLNKAQKTNVNEFTKQNPQTKNILSKIAALGGKGCNRKVAFAGGRMNFDVGGSAACISKGLERLKNPTNLSPGENANLRALKKMSTGAKGVKILGNAARVLGKLGLVSEGAIGGLLALNDYAGGSNKEEIISNFTYGLAGKSQEEQLTEQDPQYGLDRKILTDYTGLNTMGQRKDNIGRMSVKPGIEKQLIETIKKEQQPFMSGPRNEEFDMDRFYKQQEKTNQADIDYQKAKDQKALERRVDPFAQEAITEETDFMAAGGGIAGLSGGDKSGRPPESGPASQGLFFLRNNVNKR